MMDIDQGKIMGFSARRTLEQPFIVQCEECKMAFRTENLTPYTMAVRNWFCPACGSKSVEATSNYEDDRWHVLAKSFGMPNTARNATFIKELFNVWDPGEHEHFKDFVVSIITRVKTNKNLANGV